MSKSELLRSYLEERGVRLGHGWAGFHKVSCFNKEAHPRGDRNPSASVNLTAGRYKCFACGLSGDVFDLIQHETGMTYKDAVKTLGHVEERNEPTWI